MPRSGTVPSMLFVAWTIVATHGAFAATKEFPYEAVVESDEAFARCGPGKNFYPTSKLKRGDHVTVRRHDPGGWFMIDPTPDSFSLISSDDVQAEGNVGTVKPLAEGQTPIRIGSAIDPAIDSVYQRQLSSGERVEILGAATIPRRNSQVQMLKIRPPKGEFRWIEGMNLTPLDQQVQDQQIRSRQIRGQQNGNQQSQEQVDSDPFAAPPQGGKHPPSGGRPAASGKPVAKLTGSSAATRTPFQASAQIKAQTTAQPAATTKSGPSAVTSTTLVDPRGRLEQIDLQFRDMVQRQPATWNLVAIEQAYRELNQQAAAAAIRGQLELRFSAIDHYKQVKGEYDDYFRLVSSTERKDAELAAIQNSLDPQEARPAIMAPGQAPAPTDSPLNAVPNAATGPSIPLPATSVPTVPASPNGLRFDAPAQYPMNSERDTRAVGPVLENPVPVPTEPQPEANPRREVRQELPVVSPPAVAPNDMGSPRQELPTNENAAPTTQGSTSGAAETRSRPAPSADSFPPSAPVVTRTLRNADTVPQGTQPAAAPTVPPAQPMRQMPTAPTLPALAAPRQIRPQAAGGLDGAGIVQRAATPVPGGPRHVLLAPNGRILAYLYPDRGINLDAYLGRSMGIVGPRAFRAELQTDLIVVRQMVPVRLAQ